MKISKTEPKSALNTSKYSCNLIWVPTGSLILISPEKINNSPTSYVIFLCEINIDFMILLIL